MVVNDEAVTLEILDTAGQGEPLNSSPIYAFHPKPSLLRRERSCTHVATEEYAAMADQWYKYANGFLLVYSITDRVSYENLLLLHQDILRVKDRPYVPIIVLSNKVSLDLLEGQHHSRFIVHRSSPPCP